MKPTFAFPILILLPAFISLGSALTAHVLEITNHTSALLVDLDQAHSETRMLHAFFGSS